MTPGELMVKAVRAAASAEVLLDAGDAEGACDRAYYAMFNAARAALSASSPPVESPAGKTHHGLIAAFSLHLVKTGRVPVEYGKSLNKVEELRLIADYRGDAIDLDQAAWAVEQSHAFIRHIQSILAHPD